MSQENVELTMRATDAFNRRDVEAVLALWDEEGVWYPVIEATTGAGPSSYHGHAGIRQYFQDLAEFAEESIFEASDVRDLGDQVLCLGRLRMRFASGVKLDQEIGAIHTWRNGKCLEGRGYLTHAEALEAAGLSE